MGELIFSFSFGGVLILVGLGSKIVISKIYNNNQYDKVQKLKKEV